MNADHLILPAGTQIVTRLPVRRPTDGADRPAGAVGVVVESPVDASHRYRVRFTDGGEAALRRSELLVRRQVQRDGLAQTAAALADRDLHQFVIYRCIAGSRAFGLEQDGSDTDRRGIYLPPSSMHWSLYGVPEQLENDATQECYWELQKFLVMALKANPNILECLYSPLVEHATPLALELLEMRGIFLSKLIYTTYNGYVMSQFKRFEQLRRNQGVLKWKHVMHLIRLLLAGITALREGHVPVRVESYRDDLLAIRRGELPWEQVEAWRLRLHRQFDAAFEATRLPERPDYQRANAYLLGARRAMVEGME